jgi:TP901 family phage tail tape measure protein
MAVSAAEIKLIISAQEQVSAALKSAGGSVAAFGQQVDSVGSKVGAQFAQVGKAAALAGVAVAGGLVAGVAAGTKAAGDLEHVVAGISTVKPELDMSAVFGALNEMSTRIPEAAGSMGEALNNVFQNFDATTEQGLRAVETFSKGAIGAQTDATTFGSGIVGVLQAYGKSIDEASHVSDVFFNTIRDGAITGQQLASSLGPVSQSAKLAGVDLDTLGGLLVGVTREGGDAAQNVNNLNNFLQKVTTKEAQKGFKDLGVAVVDSAGEFRAMPDILDDLKVAFTGLTEAERANALQAIFPDAQARAGASVLLSQLDQVKTSIAGNVGAAGSAEAAFQKMNATFNSQAKLLGNTLTAIGATVGAELLPHITPLVTAFAKQLPGAFQAARSAIAGFSVAGTPLIQFLQDLAGTVRAAFAGDWSPDASINPIVDAVGRLATFVSQTALPSLQAFGEQAGTILSEGFATARDAVLGAGAAFEQARPSIEATLAFLNEHKGAIATVAASFAAFSVLTSVAGSVAAVAAAFATLGPAIAAAGGALPFIVALLGGPVTLAIAGVVAAVAGLALAWQANFLGIRDHTAALWAFVQPIIQSVITEVGRFGTEMLPLAQAAWQNIQSIVSAVVGIVQADVQRAISAISAFWTTHHATIEAVTRRVWDAIQGFISFAWGNVQATIKTGLQALAGDWSGAWTTMRENLQSNWDTIKGAVGPAWDAISKAIIDKVGELVSAVTKKAAEIGKGIVDGIISGATDLRDRLGTALSNAAMGALNDAKRALGIQSPSTLSATEVGVPLAEGIIAGFVQRMGGDSTMAEAVRAVVTTALKYGIDPAIALALAKAESTLNPRAIGDAGASVGLFQLHERGQGAGMSVADRQDPWKNAEAFLSRHGDLFKRLSQQYSGAELARIFGGQAEVSAEIYWGRYAEAYRELAAQFGPDLANLTGAALMPDPAIMPKLDPDRWAAVMGLQQGAYDRLLAGDVPEGTRDQMAALTDLGDAVAVLQRKVADGSISLRGLNVDLVELAARAGLTVEPFRDFDAGLITSGDAVQQLMASLQSAGPEFQALYDRMAEGGILTQEQVLDLLNLIGTYGQFQGTLKKTADAVEDSAVAANVDDVATAVAGAGATTGTESAAMVESWRAVAATVEEAREQLRKYSDYLFVLTPQRLQEQSGGWHEIGDQVLRAAEGVRRYHAALEDLEPPPKGEGDDIPEAHTGARVKEGGVAELEAGEVVLTPEQQERYGVGGGGPTYVTNNVYHQNLTVNPRPGDEFRVVENFRILEALYGGA